jgi:L-lysine exporter family protein LysE/ArgO
MEIFIVIIKALAMGWGILSSIGPQNIHVLRYSIIGRYLLSNFLICVTGDAMLILASVYGVASFIDTSPFLKILMLASGIVFLFIYGYSAIKSAFAIQNVGIDSYQNESFKKVVSKTLAVSYLNPKVYIDTLVLVGGISVNYSGMFKHAFVTGMILASITWFGFITFLGKNLRKFFQNPKAWRIMELIAGVTIIILALILSRDLYFDILEFSQKYL